MAARLPEPNDRRVQRTRRTLRAALISLLYEQGWDQIAVQDICNRADVGRSTFYTHFADKEELLIGGFEDLRAMIRAGLAQSPASQVPLGFVTDVINHAHANRRLGDADGFGRRSAG